MDEAPPHFCGVNTMDSYLEGQPPWPKSLTGGGAGPLLLGMPLYKKSRIWFSDAEMSEMCCEHG